MSKFSINYTKTSQGYNKILDCIHSCETPEQLESTKNMIQSWINLAEHYCNEVSRDKNEGPRRKRIMYANTLGKRVGNMYNDIEQNYNCVAATFLPKEYEGCWAPIRIKSIQEYADRSETSI